MASVQPGHLKSTFPVFLPYDSKLICSVSDFEDFIKNLVSRNNPDEKVTLAHRDKKQDRKTHATEELPDATLVLNEVKHEDIATKPVGSAFVAALTSKSTRWPTEDPNVTFTENGDIAYQSTENSLVDLFSVLEDSILNRGETLQKSLLAAWQEDPLITLKIIFNSRSIHLGKSSRNAFYFCARWLALEHPRTFLFNLQWLNRPVIEKKLPKDEDKDLEFIEVEKAGDDATRFDVRDGVAHGYWKDLLNLLVLFANDRTSLTNPRKILYTEPDPINKDTNFDPVVAQKKRDELKQERHARILNLIEVDPVYRALHLTVARLFAEQLQRDLDLLNSDEPKDRRQISLCAKWAPSSKLFHDKHTFIVSSIAEILHPESSLKSVSTAKTEASSTSKAEKRSFYLREAREAYRKSVSSLRSVLAVVERDITASKFSSIKYERVPSLAMSNYAGLFATKDTERFDAYIDNVASGKKSISGAVLLPSKMVHTVRLGSDENSNTWVGSGGRSNRKRNKSSVNRLVQDKLASTQTKVIDAQWKTLVQRIKDSGTLSSCMAVCDVSGSMNYPVLPDGTTPLDSAIGLSLLIAEATEAPFGGQFITFSEEPEVQALDLEAGFSAKINVMQTSAWGMNTDFVAVFEDLILPLVRKHKVPREDMVKRIFVFSDMQFDAAQTKSADAWTSSYKRIRGKFKLYGYDMPELVFWNLAGGRSSESGMVDVRGRVNSQAFETPKPVKADEPGCALVSGYSQGMLKVFMDGGAFDEAEDEEEGDVEEEIVVKPEAKSAKRKTKTDEKSGDDGDDDDDDDDDDENDNIDDDDDDGLTLVEKQRKKKKKMDPLSTVKRAVAHKAYDMLKVVD